MVIVNHVEGEKLSKAPWYVESFQEDYLKIYAHRTDEAAQDEIAAIVELLQLDTPCSVLDLCCGNGRHSRALARRGFKVTGIDLSTVLLREAEKRNSEGTIRYLRSDVRQLPFNEEFDVVLNLFTSFGYFEEWEENKKVFLSIHQALKTGGIFLIDFLNPGYVRKNLVPYSERKVDNLFIKESRRIEGNKVIKQIRVEEGQDVRLYDEQVNLFSKDEMSKMIKEAGLYVTHVYGDVAGSNYDPIESPRMIIIGKK